MHAAKMGYAKTRKEVLNIASATMQKRGIDKTVTHGWWNRLTCWHPLLTLRTPATLSHARSRASSSTESEISSKRMSTRASRIQSGSGRESTKRKA